MKVLELRFKNLNSLYGEWTVDFTSPEYISDGIFAITGPTGAGKSTILDALSLALYGRTPRLKSITKSTNEIMSRQTGDCYAEVIFETQSGRFKSHWSQRRAHSRAKGNLIESRHEIAEAQSGNLIETKKSRVGAVILEKTGMDFDRFTRSTLLAQGGFAAFLQAASDDRAPVLEQITGTQIYSDISKKIHERFRQENEQLELLKAETAGITILNSEQETELNSKLIDRQHIEQELGSKKESLKGSILWLNAISSLQSEIVQIDSESKNIEEKWLSFEPELDRLNRAIKASELEAEFAALSSTRHQQQSDLESFKHHESLLPECEKRLIEKESILQKSQQIVEESKKIQKTELELIRRVRECDLLLSEKEPVFKQCSFDRKKIDKEIADKKEEFKNSTERYRAGIKELEQIEKYILANDNDQQLCAQFEGISQQIRSLKSAAEDITLKRKKVEQQQKQLKRDLDGFKRLRQTFDYIKEKQDFGRQESRATRELLKAVLGDRSLREYRIERDGLMREMVYIKKISDLEDERKRLEDQKPCPLCGSLHHPFAEGNIPQIEDAEQNINIFSDLIDRAEHLECKIKELDDIDRDVISMLNDAEKNLALEEHKKNNSILNIDRLEEELKVLSDRYSTLKGSLLLQLKPFDVVHIVNLESPESVEDKLDQILDNLSNRLNKWIELQNRKTIIERRNSEFASELKRVDAIIQTLAGSLKEKVDTLERQKNELDRIRHDRKQMYGLKNPASEEARLERTVADAEQSEKMAVKERDKLKEQLNQIKTRISTLKEIIDKRRLEIQLFESLFIANCIKAGMEDEQTFIANRLSSAKRDTLQSQARDLEQQRADILTRKRDRESRLFHEQEKQITGLTLDELRKDEADTGELLKRNGEEIGAIKQKLSDNILAKAQYQEKYLLINTQKQECVRWGKLHSLIGSADGKKYRNFAQGITFEIMVSHANRELAKMSDRYLLVRSEKEPLELNVIDNYQAGEIRSTKNLSGGESFIVSLSLALGLSSMASRNVRVDSLFLDEGFGTLDQESLETALETLAGLKQDGKLIGVISHVSALKDRISTQIQVTPERGGRSVITGPGCGRCKNFYTD